MVKALAAMALALCVAVVAACAGESARVLQMDADPRGSRGIFFPGPPEVPRYFYAGQLTGEANYLEPGAGARSGLGRALAWIAGLDEAVGGPEGLLRPNGGTIDGEGRVLVTDASRPGVVVFHPTRGLATWLLAEGLTRFASPVGIAVAEDGRVFVADADLGFVARLGKDGEPSSAIGRGVLQRPTGLAYDPATRRLFVVDTRAHDVKVLDPAGKLLATFGHRGEGEGEFNFPTHCWLARGELYVADTMNSRIQVLSAADGRFLRSLGRRGLWVGNLVRPKGVSVDSEGNVYVVESYHDRLLVFDPAGQFLLAIGGLGKEAGEFYLPSGVWTDERNRVFVADMFNGRVVVLQFLGGDTAR